MAGDADCLNCKNAEKFEYKGVLGGSVKSLNCKARKQEMTVFKGFYCWFFEKK